MNELEFTGKVKSWVDEILQRRTDLPFLQADIESSTFGRAKRHDFVLRPRGNAAGYALTGEVKLPDRRDGHSPYAESLVLDAHWKADNAGVKHFFTWNVNRFVLWETFREGTPKLDRSLDFFDWLDIKDSGELSRMETQTAIRKRLEEFLDYFAPIFRGEATLRRKPLDQRFIHVLESALDAPANLARAAIGARYASDAGFRKRLDSWLKTNLGATISAAEELDNLDRAARFSCYVMANRIVFYDALRRRYPDLERLTKRRPHRTNLGLVSYLTTLFAVAETATHDYETVFHVDELGAELPFLHSDAAVAWWSLIEQVDQYDFTGIDYDIIGQIFDRLIGPKERHRYGQHYTKSEIVDVINAFTIRDPNAVVLDPACGGGTFLVRAYARKKWLANREGKASDHATLLSGIYGTDKSGYAAHLSTISLATRDLVQAANYPRVASRDFFTLKRGLKTFPAGIADERGWGKFAMVALADVDSCVGNPPYIRQELLSDKEKKHYAMLCGRAWPGIGLSGRSDIYVYFWPVAAAFLAREGRHIGFLTSASWLDVDYGFKLQRWMLQNFCIEAVLESSDEPWFTDARVSNVATILRRESDRQKRLDNLVRFVQIRRPLADILLDFERGGDRLDAADRVRNHLLSVKTNVSDQNWRIRVLQQADLIRQAQPTAEVASGQSSTAQTDPAASHAGGKWGMYLRAPDVFFEMRDAYPEGFVPLDAIAKVRRGVTTNCDGFFFVRDVTADRVKALGAGAFKSTYGITVSQAEAVRVCLAGDDSIHLIEARFLEPEVHSLLEIDSIHLEPDALERKILLVDKAKSELRGTYVLKYIEWGERQGYHRHRSQGQKQSSRHWYDIVPETRSLLILPKIQQYRHIVVLNDQRLCVNCSLLEITDASVPTAALAAALNSTIVGLFKWSYGRGLGREANLQLDVYSAEMMLVPDVTKATAEQRRRLKAALKALATKPRTNLANELEYEERIRLDDIVLEVIGVRDVAERRRLREKLYDAIRALHANLRALELKAQANRLKVARRGKTTPQSLAAEIWDATLLPEGRLRRFPTEFMRKGIAIQKLRLPDGDATYKESLFEKATIRVGKRAIPVGDPDRARLLVEIAEYASRTNVPLPKDPSECVAILGAWRKYAAELAARFAELAGERTTDPKAQERIVADLWRRYKRWNTESPRPAGGRTN